ncbi:MAG TPA: Wzz/FepE/Etk N-terminal domain-containing protein [Chthonomonadaceae bacterium]|nr:Wzz/FepE/Etk N-terminal domain-containing protein [Chthonomonadaceae bacterium]
MNTQHQSVPPLAHDSVERDGAIDFVLLRQILRRRRVLWTALGIGLFLVSAFVALFVYPQNYSATVSISMQKADTSSSPLAALAGGGLGGGKKYVGVIKSRNFAEKVDRVAHFRQLLGLPDTPMGQEDALDKVTRDLKVEDNPTDGLLYLTVNLDGPAFLGGDPGGTRRAECKAGAAKAANEYAKVLEDYLKNTDTDKELSLLRAADLQVTKAQAAYAASIDELAAFISHTRVRAVPVSTGAGAPAAGATTGASDVMSAGTQLSSLYLRKATLEASMHSADAMNTGVKSLLTDKSHDIASLPDEDPLLVTARKQVNEAAAELHTLQITYGPSMQSVKRAQEKLRIAEDRLHTEVQTILNGNTTDTLKRQALQAEYDTVIKQIALGESNFQYNRNMTVEMQKRQYDVQLKLAALTTTLTRTAELKLQTVSAQNRMATIDRARPPRSGKPGGLMLTFVSIAVPLFVLGAWWVVEYLVLAQSRALG